MLKKVRDFSSFASVRSCCF